MLTLIASDKPRAAAHMDLRRSLPWKGIVWTGGAWDRYGAHWEVLENRGFPLLLQRRPFWERGYFSLFDREWLTLYAGEASSPLHAELCLRLTRALMDRFDIPAAEVFSDGEARASLGLDAGGRGVCGMDGDSFRSAL